METAHTRATGARWGRRALLTLGCLAPALLAACASVDARGDLDETARLVQERTGQVEAWDPEMSEDLIRSSVEAMLADGLTVEEAVRVALLCNPGLRSAYEDVGIRKAELVGAGLPRNPLLGVSARFPEGGGLLNLTTTLSQSLVDLLLIPARKRAGQARLSIARWLVVREAVRLAGRVEGEAFDLVALQSGLAVADEGVALARHSLEVAEHRLDAGLGDAVDVQLAGTAVLAARRERLVVERDIAVRRATLQELLGLATFPGDWRLEDRLPAGGEPEDANALVEAALARRLDVEVAKLGVAAARGDLDVERNQRIPELVLTLERERAESPPSLSGPGFEVALPVWSRNEPGVARGEFLVAKAEDELRRVRNTVAREVREAAARLQGAQELVALLEKEILPAAIAGVETSGRAWQAGERDILVLLEAQRFLLEQRRAYVAALRDAARARAALEVALGGPGRDG